jgi:aquaporin Z
MTEAVGTFLLVAFGPGAAVVGHAFPSAIPPIGVALTFLLVVALMVLLFGEVSGAHINPAVTVVLAITGRFPRGEVLAYVGAQLLGAAAAGMALATLFPLDIAAAVTVPVISPLATVVVEGLLSFLLMLVILHCVSTGAGPARSALFIGAAVGLDALAGGPLTGASMNPARSFGPAIAASVWTLHWAYWVAPIGGMLLATAFHTLYRGSRDGAE